MADYAQLETYIRELKKAAIDATMTVDWGMEGSTKAGSFHGIPNGILVANAPVGGWTVTYPAGTWTDNYTGEASAPPYDPATGAVNATEAWENVDIFVESALNRLRGIPEGTGSSFDDVIPALGAASAALSPGGAMLVGDGDKAEIGVGNEPLQIYVGAIDDKLTNFSGHAIETLKTYYTNRIETTLTGQTAMAAMLAVLATGQAEIFDSARQDVADFVHDAKEAFIQLAQNHHAKKVQNTLKVVETAFSIAGLVTTGGLAKTVGKLSGIYGVIDKWADKPEISTKEVVLGGSTAAAMLSDLNSTASELGEAIREAEMAFHRTGEKCLAKVNERPASFDISEPDFLSEKSGFWAPGENIQVLKEDLIDVAGHIELISHLQKSQAGKISSALGEGPWTRELWIGMGATGFHNSFHDVGSVLVQLLNRSSRELGDVAERCVMVAHDFQSTDEAIEAELAATSKEIRHQTHKSIEEAEIPKPKDN